MLQNVNTLDTSVIKQPTHLLVWSRSAAPGHQDPSCFQKEPWRWCHTEFYREDLSGRDQRGGMEQKKKKKTGVFSHQHCHSPALKRNNTFEWKVTSLCQVVFIVRHESQFLRAPHCVFSLMHFRGRLPPVNSLLENENGLPTPTNQALSESVTHPQLRHVWGSFRVGLQRLTFALFRGSRLNSVRLIRKTPKQNSHSCTGLIFYAIISLSFFF